jgi:hypothetical protein
MSDNSTRDYHQEMQRLRALQGGGGKTDRLTVTEVARTLLDRQHRAASGSVTLTRNAKGDTQISVDVPTDEANPTVEQAAEVARKVYDELRAAYPLTSDAPVSPPPARPRRA